MKEAFEKHPYLLIFVALPMVIGLITYILKPKEAKIKDSESLNTALNQL